MADKKMNDFPTAADGAFVYAEDANGNQIKISKADLASVVAGLVIQEVYISTNEITITLPYGIYMISDNKENRSSVCFIYTANYGSGFLLEPKPTWTNYPYIITFPKANTINLKHATGSEILYIFRA